MRRDAQMRRLSRPTEASLRFHNHQRIGHGVSVHCSAGLPVVFLSKPVAKLHRSYGPYFDVVVNGHPHEAALLVVVVLALLYVVGAGVAGPAAIASPTPTSGEVASASPTATLSSIPTPTASPLPAGTFENAILGYRVTLPQGYRRASATIFTACLAKSLMGVLGS